MFASLEPYLIKGSEWINIRESHLIEIADVKKWPHLYATFGSTFERRATKSTFLDNRQLNDGEKKSIKSRHVKDRDNALMKQLEEAFIDPTEKEMLDEARVKCSRRFRKAQLKERYPDDTICTLDGEIFSEPDEDSAGLY